MKLKTTFLLFGFIPILVVVREVEEEDALYKRMSQRFTDEMKAALARVAR